LLASTEFAHVGTKMRHVKDKQPVPPEIKPPNQKQSWQGRIFWLKSLHRFILSAAIGIVAALMLTSCTHSSTVVWEYYDQCAQENPSFLAMAECGRQNRLAECVPNNTCSPEGTMFMQYIDSLALSVRKKELTEAEAMRRYKEYKSGGTPSHP
jgi:hypothetical protein